MMSEKGKYISPPSPEMLAAYVDGEFEGNNLLMARKRSIEDWLQRHPEAAEDILAWRRLKQLMQQTSAEEPSEEAWEKVWSKLQGKLTHPVLTKKSFRAIYSFWFRGFAAASVLILVGLLSWFWAASIHTDSTVEGNASGEKPLQASQEQVANSGSPVEDSTEPFPVLTEDEITIRHVSGPDTVTLVVGDPVDGPLVLLEPEDFFLNSIEPAVEDQMLPDIQMVDGPPMIWAPSAKEIYKP